MLIVGVGALVWYALTDDAAEVAAPATLSEIDLRANPELKGVVPEEKVLVEPARKVWKKGRGEP